MIYTLRTEGHVRGLKPDRVQARYEDLLRAPTPVVIDDLLLVLALCMFRTCVLGFTCWPLHPSRAFVRRQCRVDRLPAQPPALCPSAITPAYAPLAALACGPRPLSCHDMLQLHMQHCAVIRLCAVLAVAVCLAGFWYALWGQHIYTVARRHHKETEKKDHPLPTWTKEFEGFEFKLGTLSPIRR